MIHSTMTACEWITSRCETTPANAASEQASINQSERSERNEPVSVSPSFFLDCLNHEGIGLSASRRIRSQ